MTPPAATRAGRASAARNPAATRAGRASAARNGHQRNAVPRPVRAGAAIPRRVSGPVRGAEAPARTTPARPRPARPRVAPRPSAPRRAPSQRPLLPRLTGRAFAALRGLPDHRWLDRLVRGRAWIPVLGVLLAGIVATQVEVLKLGASTGRWVERTAALSSRNQALQASVAMLSDDRRIERLAAGMGMVMPAPTAITFLHRSGRGGIRPALARMQPPDPAQFRLGLPPNGTTPLLGVTSGSAASQQSVGG